MPGSRLAPPSPACAPTSWSGTFVINNYLKGQTPRAFDLLHWNGDSANLPGRLYAWYLRNMYLENNLRVPGKAERCAARPVDLGAHRRARPIVLATREDHIVPWASAYASARLLGGRIEFVLGASGHVAGVVNPPQRPAPMLLAHGRMQRDAGDWLAGARREPGSWWPHWSAWVQQHAGQRVQAPQALGSERYVADRGGARTLRAGEGAEPGTRI